MSTTNPGLQDKTDGALNKVSAGAHATVNSVAGAAEEAARKVKPTIDSVAAMAHQAVDKAASVAAPAADWLAEHGESLTAAQEKLVANTTAYITENPIKAVGIALVAGLLLGRVLR